MARQCPPKRLNHDGGHFYVYPATHYQYPISHCLNQFKDDENLQSLMVLLHAVYRLPKPVGCHADNTVIVATPTTKKRLQQRGFDPVQILVKHLSYHWQIPLWQGLVRTDNVRHQRGLSRQERLDNVQGAFVMKGVLPVRQVILFDDVLTTGATLQALANAIIKHAPNVRLLGVCMAHGV